MLLSYCIVLYGVWQESLFVNLMDLPRTVQSISSSQLDRTATLTRHQADSEVARLVPAHD